MKNKVKKAITFEESVYENTDFAFISGGELFVLGEGYLQVFDILGHQLFAKQVSTPHSSFLTPNLTAGVYVLRLINGENVKAQKIVVK